MSSSQLLERVAALRAQAREVGALLAAQAGRMPADELFEVAGELQGVLNTTEGAQLVVTAHAAAHETTLTERGPVQVHHGLGFVDAMAASEVSLATGTGQWAAGRRVSLAAALAERFPRLLSTILAGDVGTATAAKVVSACDGLDAQACGAVEAVLVGRLSDLDPARVTTVTRRIATRVAAEQVRAAQRTNRRDRCVQVSPGPDGTTTWWAQLPAAASAAAWAAIRGLGDEYASKDPALTLDQARADAFLDLLLTNVQVTARVTLGIPVITTTGPAPTDPALQESADTAQDPHASDATAPGAAGPAQPDPARPPCPIVAIGGQGLGNDFAISTALSGCELPGIGFIDPDTIETLLATVPLHVGRALLDTRTGTLLETSSTAYRPPRTITDFVTTRDGTCRMWGCDRPAVHCDLDHATPWPHGPTTPANLGDLCRRHHRLKQRRRWTYQITPDGTVTWTSPTGKKRTTLPDHALWPPPPPPPAPEPPEPTSTRELVTTAAPPF